MTVQHLGLQGGAKGFPAVRSMTYRSKRSDYHYSLYK